MSDFILRWRSRNDRDASWSGCTLTTKTSLNGGPFSSLTYHIKNLQTFNIDLDTPICIIRLPETGSCCTFVIKTQGNALSMNLSWTLHCERSLDCMCVPIGCCTLVDELDGFCCRPGPVQTVCDQLDFLVNTMENRGLDYEWDLYVGDEGYNRDMCGTVLPNITPGTGKTNITDGQAATAFAASTEFRKHIKIQKLVLTKSGATPVTYVATMTMIAGERLLQIDETTELKAPGE